MLSWLELLNNKIEDGIVHLDLFLNSYIPIFKYDRYDYTRGAS